MIIFKWACLLIGGVAPFAAVASLVGTFFGLGGWGWLLFLWFGFTGMFSLAAAQQFESARGFSTLMAILLLAAFVAGVAFALSDLPSKVSVFYALLAPLFLIPIFALIKGRRYSREHEVATREPEPGVEQRSQSGGTLEGGGTVSRLRVLLTQHPVWSLVGGVVIVVAGAIGLMPAESPIEYEKGFGEAFAYALTSPVHSLASAIGTLVLARVFVVPWQRYWVAYRATLLGQLWTGAVSMLGWALSAFADSEEVGMVVTLLLVFPGVAWVFGRFLRRSDGNPVGLLVGAKILALGVAAILTLLVLSALVLSVVLGQA